MATYTTHLIKKGLRVRGNAAGELKSVTARLPVAAGASIATTDLIKMIEFGEGTRPLRLTLSWVPASGTPVLTNPVFDVGVLGATAAAYERPDGTSYAVPATSATVFSADLTLDADNMASDVEVARPVADSVSKYAPFYVTLTPTGVGAFSVAGGDGSLELTVEFIGEENPTVIYDEYVNQKVKN